MFVVLSGEGPTDIGCCADQAAICSGETIKSGPMLMVIRQLVEWKCGFNPADVPDFEVFASKSYLADRSKARRAQRRYSLAGKKREQETGYFYVNAWMLGELAIEQEANRQDVAFAVLFRDCDGTQSASLSLWADKCKSMNDGFKRAGFERGVPMLPKPKSEAWLLGHANKDMTGAALESISGNDAAEASAKSLLAQALGAEFGAEKLCDWLADEPLDVDNAARAPSFRAFRDSILAVLAAITGAQV